jgi:hypothetical protein
MDSEALYLAGFFLLVGIFIQIVGLLISDLLNHKSTLQRIKKEHESKKDYLLSETLFKKKLEYFEKVTKFIEDYTNYYSQLLFLLGNPEQIARIYNLPEIKQLKDKKLIIKKITSILEHIKEENFTSLLPSGTSIYLKSGVIPLQMSEYVMTHTRIFTLLASHIKNNFNDNENNQEIVDLISQNFLLGNSLLESLKKDVFPKGN